MTWLIDRGTSKLVAGGLPSGWPDDTDEDLSRFETDESAVPDVMTPEPAEAPVTQH